MKKITVSNSGLQVADGSRPNVANEALIEVSISGICNTDLEIVKGYAGFQGTLGHEFAGIVRESPEDKSWIGKRVLGEINVGCDQCELCMAGDSRHCPDRTVLGIHNRDGCHAEFTTLPARNLIEIPDTVSDERAVFAEPFAAAYGITEQVEIRPDTRVAVIGDGKLGILCAWALGIKTQHLFLFGKHQSKLELGQLGNAEGVLADDFERFSGYFDVVVEASGSESGFPMAVELVRSKGKIVLKSTFQGSPVWEAWKIVVNEISVVGSRCGRFQPIVELLGDKRFPFEKLITETVSLADGVEAMRLAGEKGVMKVLLRPESRD
ncbi:MAG: alcohol dehydrogenase catalytic domain-containing protein [Pyrinomonadaceae bacterium]